MAMQFGDDPYDSDHSGIAQTRSKSSKWPLLIFLVGGPLLVVFLCCGGGVGMMMLGMNVLSAEIEVEMRDHPQFREHIGEVQSFDLDWAKSFAVEGDNTFIFDVRGTKGSGELTVDSVTNDAGAEEIRSAELRLSNGETVVLDMS
jgi:hypothetical protein